MAGLKTFVEEWNGHNAFAHLYSGLMNCFNKVTFSSFLRRIKMLHFSREEKMLGLSFNIKMSILSKSGHSTFVLSTIDVVA